jgi:hypothetical protein
VIASKTTWWIIHEHCTERSFESIDSIGLSSHPSEGVGQTHHQLSIGQKKQFLQESSHEDLFMVNYDALSDFMQLTYAEDHDNLEGYEGMFEGQKVCVCVCILLAS